MKTCHLWLEAAVALLTIAGANCLRGVSLEVVPEVVQRGEEVILRCHYDLENAPLYSLKWYRGRHEFYRFSPTEESSTKIFNISGINVDPDNSNKSQVTLRNVDFGLSGTFICEVTADAPTFSTATASKNLTVVFLPREEPIIVSERDRYDPGDMLRANCSLPPSKPPVHLSFTLNSTPLETTTRQQRTKEDEGTQWSEISLTLQPFHYTNGRLNLRCTAEIPGIYTKQSELHLLSGMSEPVPERVTSENGSGTHTMTFVTILCLGTLHLLLR
ncbi:platelet endothelial cell adhesion molecule [Mycetomoellerius zeteki]|uniref:platelet endothelial cell adhesion molecule n=1 Tax=Mycetomoellerius zeteki TaxID=64791 RepID=UPI00084E3CFA|nr:PREDICTED: platelet endothelial cell adhesion molecule-like [Trachymyrmex zeteki]